VGSIDDWGREHRFADVIVLLAVVCFAMATWSCLAAAGAPLWKLYLSVLASVILGLAALTRHAYWAGWKRLLMGGWIIVAPWLLGFADRAPRTWLPIGTVLIAAGLAGVVAGRTQARFDVGRASAGCIEAAGSAEA